MTSESTLNERDTVHEVARRGRVAAADLRQLTRNEKDAALRALADALVTRTPEIVSANAIDVERAQGNGTSAAIIDRLTLTAPRISDIAQALREADEQGIKGKASTPFLLARVCELTGGSSLAANIQLVLSNAALGARIAASL
jgi:hypothetical protein